MNQKFSQLNKDYAKRMAWRDDAVLKRSTRRGLGSFLFGLFIVLTLLAAFFSFKTSLLKEIQQKINNVSLPPEKSKPSAKPFKAKEIPPSTQEYGFYTILPNVEVRSAHHEES
jgi:hypothetical protein